MGLLLRLISIAKWSRPDWMEKVDIPADTLGDLRSEGNTLSVWRVNEDRSNISVSLSALASSRQKVDKLDYALFDENMLSEIAIKCVSSEGDTPHLAANSTLHADLIELTVRKTALLANAMMPCERNRLTAKQVERLLVEALDRNALDRNRMDSKLLSQLGHGSQI